MINNVFKITDKYLFYLSSHFLLKKMILNHFVNFIESNNILYDSQFDFRMNHLTIHAIITLVGRVSKALDTGK